MSQEFAAKTKFIGFDGWTGSMQPAYEVTEDGYIHPRGTVLDGFLKPVQESDRENFIAALFDKPAGE